MLTKAKLDIVIALAATAAVLIIIPLKGTELLSYKSATELLSFICLIPIFYLSFGENFIPWRAVKTGEVVLQKGKDQWHAKQDEMVWAGKGMVVQSYIHKVCEREILINQELFRVRVTRLLPGDVGYNPKYDYEAEVTLWQWYGANLPGICQSYSHELGKLAREGKVPEMAQLLQGKIPGKYLQGVKIIVDAMSPIYCN